MGYKRVVRIGNQVAVSGTTAARDGEVVGRGDPVAQTETILDTIEWALGEVDASMDDVIRYRAWLADVRHWEAVAGVLDERFGPTPPANTLLGIGKLVNPDLLIEIEVDAVVEPPPAS